MKKISKEKRTHMVLVAMVVAGIIAGLWFGLISYQNTKLNEVSKKIGELDQQMQTVLKTVADAKKLNSDLNGCSQKLDLIETTMASGDLFSWIVSSLKQFNVPSYRVEVPQFGAPAVADVTMFPSFPYKQATVGIGGTAFYYDFGKFLADLENHFPHMRVQNLTLEPSPGNNPDEKERLAFRMEIVTLVKP
ncbi:hypothetical protein [Pedosphaera parvula]|uniref:Fimbrial assembly family protein n=1 Tax=Pedosphaera parvula (strain Ellin514) TaxID=320771 RepID=B9XBV5_PEDPL|nr:hypothetical protein [Pedosphaera parvula]EEF62423.1 hypothetical protein Cflav_PD5058 [Pedosphaera parvula Ellin514]